MATQPSSAIHTSRQPTAWPRPQLSIQPELRYQACVALKWLKLDQPGDGNHDGSIFVFCNIFSWDVFFSINFLLLYLSLPLFSLFSMTVRTFPWFKFFFHHISMKNRGDKSKHFNTNFWMAFAPFGSLGFRSLAMKNGENMIEKNMIDCHSHDLQPPTLISLPKP